MKIIGHRGASGLAPENTIASLKKTLQYDIDGIEFDLRVTSDDVVVLHHNARLINQTGNGLIIADSTYKELKNHKYDLATFDEAISTINKAVKMHIEIKPGVEIGPIVSRIKKAGLSTSDYEFSSFSQTILKELRQVIPEASLAVLEKWSVIRAMWRARKIGTNIIAMNYKYLWPGFIRLMSKRGYKLWAYTVNDPRRANQMARHGLEGITTDFPDRFVNTR